MQIRYTRHARKRMIERHVSEHEVSETIESPDDIISGTEGETIALRRFARHVVRVIFQELDEDAVLVYTVIKVRWKANVQE
jgi:hypothetical protein